MLDCAADLHGCQELDAVMVAGRMLLKIVYLLTCRVPGMTLLVFHGDQAKDAAAGAQA
jgi:hypothetical protein